TFLAATMMGCGSTYPPRPLNYGAPSESGSLASKRNCSNDPAVIFARYAVVKTPRSNVTLHYRDVEWFKLPDGRWATPYEYLNGSNEMDVCFAPVVNDQYQVRVQKFMEEKESIELYRQYEEARQGRENQNGYGSRNEGYWVPFR
ncbi:MAG: hypothetical protein QGF32_06645, partial [Candidatus Thalassarchaeaceae archaeon]|nr:hypothetical protein [Candidatus Thalassarchaeaceae archaeon]